MALDFEDNGVGGSAMKRAVELTAEALAEIARITVEEILAGLETSNHVEAAERDMRSALRQLVLAQREQRARQAARGTFTAPSAEIEEVLPGLGAEALPPS